LPIEVDLEALRITCRSVSLGNIEPLIDGEVPRHSPPELENGVLSWKLDVGVALLKVEPGETPRLLFRLEGIPRDRPIASIGFRIGLVEGVQLYLRNGYQSWDGSFFVEPGTSVGDGPPAKAPTLGFAMTALLPSAADGALVLGFTRHDRFQSRFDFGGSAEKLFFDVQTLWDRVPHDGIIAAEPLVLIEDGSVEGALRCWSRTVAEESSVPPRVGRERITGWCSWYSLYAAIDEPVILEHLTAATRFRDEHDAPLDIFQIDDGFTPEMGDWLDVKAQFPRGVKPLIDEIASAGFTPGLWIAPFLVGNRSRLYAEHPDWVVQRPAGGPLAHMTFYGEFRWHKRSEEYYVLDITHRGAAAYIGDVFRAWRHDWGARYFKTDFMNAGMEYGPDQAVWHEPGLSRVEIWRRMAAIIREEIGDALWLGCGCPLWASVGFVDAVRVGRDVGVSWHGEYSAESLVRDLQTRNHASGILWQADPDCVLLRDRFHHLSNEEVRSLLLFAGLSGGVLMTSDKLDEIPKARAALFADLLRERSLSCDFPELGSSGPIVLQRSERPDGAVQINIFNPTDKIEQFRSGNILAGDDLNIEPHSCAVIRTATRFTVR
jgi:alpha-galactosidase